MEAGLIARQWEQRIESWIQGHDRSQQTGGRVSVRWSAVGPLAELNEFQFSQAKWLSVCLLIWASTSPNAKSGYDSE